MKSQQKLVAYREALVKFSKGKLRGYAAAEEPKPAEFDLRTDAELFMAKKIREEHFGK